MNPAPPLKTIAQKRDQHAAALARLAAGIIAYPEAASGLAKCAELHARRVRELSPPGDPQP